MNYKFGYELITYLLCSRWYTYILMCIPKQSEGSFGRNKLLCLTSIDNKNDASAHVI
jgi:hypothetical protein